jgi:hypothetical protein
MNSPDFQRGNLDILPLVAALVGASISIFFSQLSISDAYESFNDMGCYMTIMTVFTLYFFAFYSISRVLLSRTISIYLLGGIFLSCLFIIFVGISDINGRFINVYLGFLITTLLITLWKAGIKRMQKWDVFFIYLFLLSSAYTTINSSKLQVENDFVLLGSIEDDEDGFIHIILFVQMEAQEYDVRNIKVELDCLDDISSDWYKCKPARIDILEKDEKRTAKLDIRFRKDDCHSFFLYLTSSNEICCKEILADFKDGKLEVEMQDVNLIRSIQIFLKRITNL